MRLRSMICIRWQFVGCFVAINQIRANNTHTVLVKQVGWVSGSWTWISIKDTICIHTFTLRLSIPEVQSAVIRQECYKTGQPISMLTSVDNSATQSTDIFDLMSTLLFCHIIECFWQKFLHIATLGIQMFQLLLISPEYFMWERKCSRFTAVTQRLCWHLIALDSFPWV